MNFLYPLFLWAFICLSIPIIIHFFYFNKYKKVSFSNVLMLKELKEEQTAKNKIKKWLVLLSRLLIIFFLVMAFVQPFFGGMDKRASAYWTAIYIDNSMSMSVEDGEGLLLNQAKTWAKKYISLQSKTMRYHIISNDIGKSRAKFLSSDEAINELDNIKLSASEVSLENVYRKQISIIDEKEGVKNFLWFSDFQKMPAFENVSDEIDLSLFALRAEDYINIFIDSVWTDPEYLNLNTNSNLCIKLSSNSEADKEVTIEVLVNNEIRAIKNIAFSGKSIIDTVGVVFSESSWNSTEVRISDFPVTFDNTHRVSFKVSDRIKVLSLFDDTSSRPLTAVLAQENIIHSNKLLDDFNIVDFEDCSICILDGLDRLSETLQTGLVQFVKKGGDLVIFPSGNIDSYTYDALSRKLKIARYGSVQKKETYLRKVNISSDLFDGVFKEIPRNVEWPWVNRAYEMVNTSGNYYPSNLQFSNGAPLLFEHKHNLSQIYQFGIGLDSSFSNLDKHILFPPLIYNIIVQSEDGNRQSLELGKEHMISMKFLKAPSNPGDISLSSDGFEMFPERRKINGELMFILGRDITETGFYNLMNDSEILSQYAFNYPKEESSMPYIKLEDMRLRSKIKTLDQIDRSAVKKGSLSLGEKSQLWKLCLIFVLAFIIIESLLLKYF